MMIKCMIDTTKHIKKPNNNEIPTIQRNLKQTEISIEDLATHLKAGATFKPAFLNGTKSDSWVHQQIFALDFDEGTTLDKEIEFAKSINIMPVFVYTSFSHTEEKHKFRMVFCTDEVITDVNVRNKLQITLINIFKHSDRVTYDCARLFFGGKNLYYTNYDNRINAHNIIDQYYKDEYCNTKNINKKQISKPVNSNKKSNSTNENIEAIKTLDVDKMKSILNITDNKEFKSIGDRDNYINKIDLNEYLGIYDKVFNCILPTHEDNNPSANIFISKNGTPLYKCFGCGCIRTIIGITEELANCSRHEAIKYIMTVYNLTVAKSEWVEEQKQIMLDSINYLKTEEFKEEFPYFNKVIKTRKEDIQAMLLYFTQFVNEDLKVDNKPIFFATYTTLKDVIQTKKDEKLTQSLTLFSLLDMLERVELDKVPTDYLNKAKSISKKYGFKKLTSFYSFSEYGVNQLKQAERKAKILNDNNFTLQGCSREYILRTFGIDEANRVYPQYKCENKKGTSSLSNHNTEIIAKKILRCIDKEGYIFENRIMKNNAIKKQWKKSIQEILEGYNLKRIRVNKDVKNRYNIKTNTYGSYIIVRDD